MKGLDLSKFKKVGTKDGKTTFKHADGHWLSVAHKSLSEGYRKQIDSLPSYNEETTNFDQGGQVPPVTPQGVSNGFKKATGVKMFKDGGNTIDGVEADPSDVSDHVVTTEERANLSPDNSIDQVPDAPPTPVTAPQDPAAASAGLDQPVQPDPSAPAHDPQAAPASQAAAPQQGPEAAKALMAKESADFEDDLNKGHIKSETYQDIFNKKDTLGKIGTIFGMLVGGGLGGTNTALEMMHQQIMNDQSDQQHNQANRQAYAKMKQQQPLLDAEIAKTGADTASIKQAMDYTRKFQVSFKKVTDMVAKMPPGPAKDAAIQGAQAMYQAGSGRVADMQAAASIMTPQPEQGQPQGQAQVPSNGGIKPILHPGADRMFQGMQFSPVMEKDYPQVKEQFLQAQQAQKALDNLGPTFDRLTSNKEGLLGSSVKRASQLADNLKGLPFHIGEFAAGPVHGLSNMFEGNRDYDSAKTALVSDITNALRGTNVGGDAISKIVDDNAPVKGDSAAEIQRKRDTIEGFIRRSTPTTLLKKYHLAGQ